MNRGESSRGETTGSWFLSGSKLARNIHVHKGLCKGRLDEGGGCHGGIRDPLSDSRKMLLSGEAAESLHEGPPQFKDPTFLDIT